MVRLHVVPGVTGPWQVGGRNTVLDFEEVGKYSVFTLYSPFRLVIDAERAAAVATARAAAKLGREVQVTIRKPGWHTTGTGTFQISGSTSFNFVNLNGGGYPTLLLISGGNLQGIQFTPDTPSAQVKSAVLLAGLQADGETVVTDGHLQLSNGTKVAVRNRKAGS